MDRTQIDILTQLPIVRSEGIATTRKLGDELPFDRHFRTASGNDAASSSTPSPARRDSRDNTQTNNRASTSPASESDRPTGREDREYGSVTASNESESDDSDESNAGEIAAAAATQPQRDVAPEPDEVKSADVQSRLDETIESAKARGEKAADTKRHVGNTKQLEPGAEAVSNAAQKSANDSSLSAEAAKAEVAATTDVGATPSIKKENDEVAAAEGKPADEVALNTQALAQEAATKTLQSTDVERAAATGSKKSKDSVDRNHVEERKDAELTEVSSDLQTAPETRAASAALTADGLLSAATELTADESEPRKKERAGAAQQSIADVDTPGAVAPAAATSPVAVPPVAVAASTAGTNLNSASSSNNAANASAKPIAVVGEATENAITALARLERNGLLGGRVAHRGGGTRDVPHVDPAKFVSRVARAIETAQERGTPLLLRLSPPELGSLRLELTVQQGALSATVEADNQNARQVLLENLPALRDRLADQNIRIERFDVDVRRDGEGRDQPGFQPKEQHEHRGDRAPHRQAAAQSPRLPEAIASAPAIAAPITNTSINVVA